MVPVSYRHSRPDLWAVPRWKIDPAERRRIYGPIQPMDVQHGELGRCIAWLRRHFRR